MFPIMIFRVDPDCFLSKIWIPSYGNDLDSIRTFSPCQPVSASNSSSSSWCSASFQVKVSEKHQHLKITCNIKNILRSSSEKNGGEPPGTNIDFWELSRRLCVPLAACCHLRLSYTAQHCLYMCWNLQVLSISCHGCKHVKVPSVKEPTQRWENTCSHSFCYSASFVFMHFLNACYRLFCCLRWGAGQVFPFFRQETHIEEAGKPDTNPESQLICNYCNLFLGSRANLVELNASGLQEYGNRKMWDLPRGWTKTRAWMYWIQKKCHTVLDRLKLPYSGAIWHKCNSMEQDIATNLSMTGVLGKTSSICTAGSHCIHGNGHKAVLGFQ